MKRFVLGLFTLLTVVSFSSEPLVVGMELQYPPFETIDKEGNPTGVSVGMAEKLGEYLGREVVIENVSYPGLIPALVSGKIDAIISSMTINEQRARRVDFSDAYTTSQTVILANKNSKVMSVEDVNNSNVSIAVKAGTIGALWAQANAPKATVRTFSNESQVLLDVAQGKSDILIYGALSVMRYHKRYPETTRPIMETLPHTNGWGIAIQKGQPELLKKINEFLSSSRTNGTFDLLRDKYLKERAEEFERETGLKFFF